MNWRDASRLAQKIDAAWPGKAREGTLGVYADRLLAWDLEPAEVAVNALIDSCRYFPSVVDMREAYMAAGGDLPDPGRNMSPPVEIPKPLSPEDQAEVLRLMGEVRRRLSAKTKGQRVWSDRTTEEDGEG